MAHDSCWLSCGLAHDDRDFVILIHWSSMARHLLVGAIAAASLAINATGGAHVATKVLLTPEQIDAAVKKSVSYRAPGA